MGDKMTVPVLETTESAMDLCQKCQGLLADGTQLKKDIINQTARRPPPFRTNWVLETQGSAASHLKGQGLEGTVGHGASGKPTQWTPLAVVAQQHFKKSGSGVSGMCFTHPKSGKDRT